MLRSVFKLLRQTWPLIGAYLSQSNRVRFIKKPFEAGVIKDDDLEEKLRKFQSLTGISETKYKELWDKRGKLIAYQ